jgi:hypothetical protein
MRYASEGASELLKTRMKTRKKLSEDELLREAMRRLSSLGGKARTARMTPAERSALARKAGKASGVARRRPKERA